MAPRSGGEQFYPGPCPASPATRAPHRLQKERGEAPRQSTARDRGEGGRRERSGQGRSEVKEGKMGVSGGGVKSGGD